MAACNGLIPAIERPESLAGGAERLDQIYKPRTFGVFFKPRHPAREQRNNVRCRPAVLAWLYRGELATACQRKRKKQLIGEIRPGKGIGRHETRDTPRRILGDAFG